jgi:hypothetical protein
MELHMNVYIPQPPHREPQQVRDIWSALAIFTFIGAVLFCFATVVS